MSCSSPACWSACVCVEWAEGGARGGVLDTRNKQKNDGTKTRKGTASPLKKSEDCIDVAKGNGHTRKREREATTKYLHNHTHTYNHTPTPTPTPNPHPHPHPHPPGLPRRVRNLFFTTPFVRRRSSASISSSSLGCCCPVSSCSGGPSS